MTKPRYAWFAQHKLWLVASLAAAWLGWACGAPAEARKKDEPPQPDGATNGDHQETDSALGEPAPGKPPEEEKSKPQLRLSRPGPPNIVLITVDTLRQDHMGIYGYKRDTTPRADEFFQDAAIFTRFHSTGPATRFAMPPMLTSRHYTEIHRSRGHWPFINERENLLGEYLKTAGYFSAAVHTIHYFQRRFNLHHGFDIWDTSCLRGLDRNGWKNKAAQEGRLKHFICTWGIPTAKYVNKRIIQHLDEVDFSQKQPFFLWAYYSDPHMPYFAYRGRKFREVIPRFGGYLRDRYDREVLYADIYVGKLLDELKARGLDQDTVFIYMSDHGEGVNPRVDHDRMYHSADLYQELLLVPLLIKGPGIQPRRISEPTSLLDLLPTFLELAGAEPDPRHRGMSLVPWLVGEDPEVDRVLWFEKRRAQDFPHNAMLDWPLKIISYGLRQKRFRYEVYDLEKDPRESRNLYHRRKELPQEQLDALKGRFLDYLNNTLEPAPGNPRN